MWLDLLQQPLQNTIGWVSGMYKQVQPLKCFTFHLGEAPSLQLSILHSVQSFPEKFNTVTTCTHFDILFLLSFFLQQNNTTLHTWVSVLHNIHASTRHTFALLEVCCILIYAGHNMNIIIIFSYSQVSSYFLSIKIIYQNFCLCTLFTTIMYIWVNLTHEMKSFSWNTRNHCVTDYVTHDWMKQVTPNNGVVRPFFVYLASCKSNKMANFKTSFDLYWYIFCPHSPPPTKNPLTLTIAEIAGNTLWLLEHWNIPITHCFQRMEYCKSNNGKAHNLEIKLVLRWLTTRSGQAGVAGWHI